MSGAGRAHVNLRGAAAVISVCGATVPAPPFQRTEAVLYLRELVLSYRRRPEPVRLDCRGPLNTPRKAAIVVHQLLSQEAVEVFGILCLSTKHHLAAYHEVSRGSLDTTVVHPRDAFKAAILANAAGVILAHNHPSGDPAPSLDDIALTKRLETAGEIVGIDVLDHVIVGHEGRYFSFSEAGAMTANSGDRSARAHHREEVNHEYFNQDSPE